jgi:hypothetical protein
VWKLLRGREIKNKGERVYWPYQQERHFVAQQHGYKARVAAAALKIKKRGGLRKLLKRRKKSR